MASQDSNAEAMGISKGHTYHCLCSQLIFSSSLPLSQYSRRAGEGLDKAYILPLLPSFSDVDEDGDASGQSKSLEQPSSASIPAGSVATLLNTSLDEKPMVVRREDGFEKRYLQRCGRCRLVVGYQLDKSQYDGSKSFGRRDDVVYILPGAVMSTEEMTQGKDMSSEIAFRDASSISSKS